MLRKCVLLAILTASSSVGLAQQGPGLQSNSRYGTPVGTTILGNFLSLAAWNRVRRDPHVTVVCSAAVERSGRATVASLALLELTVPCSQKVPRFHDQRRPL